MDKLCLLMLDLGELIDGSPSECDQYGYRQHRQDENQVIDDQIDISSHIEILALGAQES